MPSRRGLCRCWIVLATGLLGIAASAFAAAQTPTRMPHADVSRRYLALGDSYTIGEAVPATARWPVVLAERLRKDGVTIDDPQIIAVTGWTTDELMAAIDRAAPTPDNALVTLLIGVNNQYRGRPVGEYRQQFATLLARAVALAGRRAGRVVVVSIPDWGITAFGQQDVRGATRIGAELNDFNAIARDETLRAGARWVDITGISRQHAALVADDGLHPSAAQYALWVEAILPVARQALRQP